MLLVPAVSEQLQAASVNQVVDGFEGSEANAPFGEIYGGTAENAIYVDVAWDGASPWHDSQGGH